MRTTIAYAVGLALLIGPGAALAEENLAAARAKAIAPFLDEAAIGVLHADLSRIPIARLLDSAAPLLPEVADDRQQIEAGLTALVGTFTKAGSRDLYVVVTLADLRRELFFLVVPLPDGADPKPLTEFLLAPQPYNGPRVRYEAKRVGGSLVFGPRGTVERVTQMQAAPFPTLAAAFEAAGDTAVQAILLPPAHTARVIEELVPRLPKEIGGGPSTILTRGLLWAAVGIDVAPKLSLRAVVQSQDPDAAAALRGKWIALVEVLSAKENKEELKQFGRVLDLLTPNVEGSRLVLKLSGEDGSLQAFLAAIGPPIRAMRRAALRSQSVNNLKQIAIGMHNYHDVYKHFPGVGSFDAEGKPLLSWRVLILPFVEQNKLYDQFRLDEPWDSEHNRKLIQNMPAVFRCPASKHKRHEGLSTYRFVVGEETVFTGGAGIPIREIKDGTSHTILAVEVDDRHAVVWTKPEGLPFNPENPIEGLGGQFERGFDAVLCDGSVHFIEQTIDPAILRALFTRAGEEKVSH